MKFKPKSKGPLPEDLSSTLRNVFLGFLQDGKDLVDDGAAGLFKFVKGTMPFFLFFLYRSEHEEIKSRDELQQKFEALKFNSQLEEKVCAMILELSKPTCVSFPFGT
jgi:hypothetical protein